jgi:hypothetical protein
MSEEINVQVKFKEDTAKGEYSDALYLPYAEYQAKTEKEKTDWRETEKKKRKDNWLAYIEEESKKEGKEE